MGPIFPVGCLLGHTSSVCALSFDDAQASIVSGDEEGFVKVWSSKGRCIQTIKLDLQIVSLCIINDALWVHLRGFVKKFKRDGVQWRLDADSDVPVGHLGFFKALFKDDAPFAYPSIKGPEVVSQRDSKDGHVLDISFDGITCHCGVIYGDTVIYGLDDGTICFVSNGIICKKSKILEESIFCVSVLGQYVAVGGASKQVAIFDRSNDDFISYAQLIDQGISDIALNANEVYVSCWDGKIRVFDFQGSSKTVLDIHEGVVNKLMFSKSSLNLQRFRGYGDGNVLVSGGRDGRIFLWALK